MDNTNNNADDSGFELEVGNYYGKLRVRLRGDVPEWAIENYDGYDWKPIPMYLYAALVKHKNGGKVQR